MNLIENKKIILLTGGISSGKSTVVNIFKKYKITIVCADTIAKEMVGKNSDSLVKIVMKFGDKVLLVNKTLNRKVLKNIIFNDKNSKTWLENLLHPLIRDEIQTQTLQAKNKYVVIDIPLLNNDNIKNFPKHDEVIVIDITKKNQISRLLNRDKISIEVAKNIIKNQISVSERLKLASVIFDNNSTFEILKKQVEIFISKEMK